MRTIYKLPLSILGFLIGGFLLIFISYYLYYHVNNNSSIIVDSPISINYISSSKITENNYHNIKFSVTNDGADSIYYYIFFSGIDTKKEFTYDLKSNNNINVSDVLKNKIISSYISINPGETHNYTLNINYDKKSVLKGEIKVRRESNSVKYFAEVILTDNELKKEPKTEIASTLAIEDEGLIIDNDDIGPTYYFRGNVKNNYVNFADKIWRIVRINGDGTIKLVLNDILESVNTYHSPENGISYKDSNILHLLDDWYEINLKNYADLIATQKFCNDNSLVDEEKQIFAAYNRATIDKIATFKCLGLSLNLKIGLLNIDEVLYAGASISGDNNSFYLYNSDITDDYFLMSGSKHVNFNYHPFLMTTKGSLNSNTAGTLLRGIRPVINIVKNVLVEGKGTIEEPYKLLDLNN